MKKLILILFFCLLTTQAYTKECINVVILFDKSYENQSGGILSKELNNYMNNDLYKISRIYMNCDATCTENKMQLRFEKALRKAENRDPNYLIISNQNLWDLYHHQIVNFKNKLHVKVGLFNMFKSSDNFQFDFGHDFSGFFIDYSTIDLNTFMFYTKRNGIEFDHFYILRDESAYSLKIATHLKKILRTYGRFFQIEVTTLSSIQGLKNKIIELQNKPQGIIIPIIKQVMDSDIKKEIMTTITHHNKKHFELSVLEDDTEYLCFSLSHIINNEFVKFKKYPDYSQHIDQLNMGQLLNHFGGDKNIFAIEKTYFIMNEERVKEIFGGYKLLRFKNDFVDFLR